VLKQVNHGKAGNRDDAVATNALSLLLKVPTRVSLFFTGKVLSK
jgi:hypothetical protein